MEFWTSFKDELKACKVLTIGVIVCTISVGAVFVDSLIRGHPLWFLVLSLLVIWVSLTPKKIKVCEDGIVRLGRLISWRDLKLVGEENGKLVFKYRNLELRIPREIVKMYLYRKSRLEESGNNYGWNYLTFVKF